MRVLVISDSAQLVGFLAGAAEQRGHDVVAILTTHGPDRRRSTGYREVVARFGESVDVISSARPSLWARMFEPYDLDLFMCCGFPFRLPGDFLGLPRCGAINMHPSLLPKYRGAGPNVFGWILRNDERETGLTIHRMAPEFDTGPVLVQERVPIEPGDHVHDVMARFGPIVPGLLDRALAAVEAGEAGTPQEEGGFYCEPFEESWREVDWSRPAHTVYLQVRSWTGLESQGHAVGQLDGDRVVLRRTRLIPNPPGPGAEPGTVLRRDQDGILVQCGDSPILVVDWAPV
ncbi:MAG: methionyl-tRNA formyltransferase [Candidatus Dormibacteria bacterium]